MTPISGELRNRDCREFEDQIYTPEALDGASVRQTYVFSYGLHVCLLYCTLISTLEQFLNVGCSPVSSEESHPSIVFSARTISQ